MRSQFKKSLQDISLEEAHGGSGMRQVIFSKADAVSENFEAMTKGFLNPGFAYDWHSHNNIDEFFIVLAGQGVVQYESGAEYKYSADDVFYTPANISHRIEASGDSPSIFYFVRITG